MADIITLPWMLEERDAIITSNIGLAHKYAARFCRGTPDDDDVKSAAICGLIEAADLWVDGHAEHASFAMLALGLIRKAVLAHVFGERNGISVPPYVNDLWRSFRENAVRLEFELGRAPSTGEVAKRMGLRRKQIPLLRRIVKLYRAERLTWGSGVDIEDATAAFKLVDDRDEVEHILGELTPRQQEIIRAWANEANTASLGITPGTVRATVRRAAGRVRRWENAA